MGWGWGGGGEAAGTSAEGGWRARPQRPRLLSVLTQTGSLWKGRAAAACLPEEETSRCPRDALSNSAFLSPPPPPSTVTLNSRNGACPVAKEDDCKAPRLVEKKIPEGDLLLQVSPPPLTSRFCPRGSTCSQPDPPPPSPRAFPGGQYLV